MKCFTIVKNKIQPHIDLSAFRWCQGFPDPSHVSTAALQLYVDSAWESKDIINGLRFHNDRESLLYGVAYLSEGDTESHIIPAGTIALSVPVCGYSPAPGTDDWSMPITFSRDKKILLCFAGNTFISTPDDKFIINVSGKPKLVDSIDMPTEPPDGTIWEF